MNKTLKQEYNSSYSYDDYGHATTWFFVVADYLYHINPGLIPGSWDYQHSSICDGSEDNVYKDFLTYDIQEGLATLNDVVHFGNVLVRYISILQAEGRDY